MSKVRIIGLTLVALLALTAGMAMAAAEKCPEGAAKLEAGPWEYCSKDGIIVGVCIKAGTKTFFFKDNGSDGCYDVKGLGTDCVTVGGGGTGRDCKDISNVVFYVEKK